MTNLTDYDVCVIGGGINGVGIATDAAGRGLNVVLCEQGDLGNYTSSSSTKLIHGGLRYLEHYEFRLVREALREREVLLKRAPHIIWPLAFLLPHHKGLRPYWLIRLGLFLYDHLAKRKRLPASRGVKLQGSGLQEHYQRGFEYYDCWVDDARLVVLNAMLAREKGARILPRHKCIKAERFAEHWQVTLLDIINNQEISFSCRCLVNAAGPWVNHCITHLLEEKPPQSIRLVKGSHIVVKKFFPGDKAFILQNTDNRVVFAIPYEGEFALIGTTDEDHQGDIKNLQISQPEIDYLLATANNYFQQTLTQDAIVWSYAGVRPLHGDGSEKPEDITRDYQLEWQWGHQQAALLSIYGGKITTYRKLAELACELLRDVFPNMGQPWTKDALLPGAKPLGKYPWLPDTLYQRYQRTYGSLAEIFLAGKASVDELGEHHGHGLYQAEVDYLREHEWAMTEEDILWRRTKLGLCVTL
ncbi:MAG: glycerol-3-phosphate dehydrogenase [Legionellales bacterium]|nr:glycerol-3-phosphate dehydrogenase [Legionellales bacterium]|tara:strand:- start:17736 stop:19148 length:1413 start_codon:yes stop_codon:yes gene_type:complete